MRHRVRHSPPRRPKKDAIQTHYDDVMMDFFKTELPQNSILRISDEKTLRLIELYEQEPCLWDTTHADYRNRQRRALAADRVAANLGLRHFKAKHVLTKFKNLRNSYCQELKKVAFSLHSGARGDDVYQPRVFWFAKIDSFLRPHLQPNPDSCHMYPTKDDEMVKRDTENKKRSGSKTKETEMCDDERDPADWDLGLDLGLDETGTLPPLSEESSDDEPLAKRHRRGSARREKTRTGQILKRVTSCLETLSEQREDAYEQFGRYVAALLRSMAAARARALQPQLVALLTAPAPAPAPPGYSPPAAISQSHQDI